MSIFVFIESNTTGTGALFLRKAIERGLTPYFLTSRRSKYPFLDELHVVTISIDTSDADKVLEFVSKLDDVAGVFSSSEYFIEIASDVATRLGLKTGNSAAIRTCRDKKQLVEALDARGVNVPRSFDLSLWDLTRDHVVDLPYPVVVKPRTGSGSVNVRLIENVEEVLEHCERMRKDGEVSALVQEYVRGTEYSVETLTIDGRTQVLGIVRKHLGPEPLFVEVGHSFPARLDVDERTTIEQVVLRGLRAVGFAFGPAHTELRLQDGKATIIEINPRLAGGLIPLLLDEVFESDLLDQILGMWIGACGMKDFTAKRYGAIRFALPAAPGMLIEPISLGPEADGHASLRVFHVMRKVGDHLTLQGDFRDRVAAVICTDNQHEAVEAFSDRVVANLRLVVHAVAVEPASRPARGLPPALQSIIYGSEVGNSQTSTDLDRLFEVNEAHLIMLGQSGLVSTPKIARLLEGHRKLRLDGYEDLRWRPRPRGLYMMLEARLMELLGDDVGGVLQTGRSRNDINATVTKLMLRDAVTRVFNSVWRLRASLVFRASQESDQPFPLYSQYQPALPGTFSHQLLAFEQALACESRALLDLLKEINVCPMGAGAGGGTTLPIDQELVCKLLGFASPSVNSLDAVANRSGVVHFLSAMNAIALLLSRMAQDMQMWTTMESHLVRLPDDLCGGSSALPQKRNPFLIEFMKSRATTPLGALTTCSAVIGKTPFTNSFEVSSEVNRLVSESEQSVCDVATVATALIDGLEVDGERADSQLRGSAVSAMAVTEAITLRGELSFRTAHTQVGDVLRTNSQSPENTYQALLGLDHAFMARPPLAWALSHQYGGGPGALGPREGLSHACTALADDATTFEQFSNAWRRAASMRQLAVEQMVSV